MTHQDYIGQDLIWRLRGIHPYEQNSEHFHCCYTPHTPKMHKEITDFILSHLNPEWIPHIETEDFLCEDGQYRNLITKIFVRNVFGKENFVEIKLVLEMSISY